MKTFWSMLMNTPFEIPIQFIEFVLKSTNEVK